MYIHLYNENLQKAMTLVYYCRRETCTKYLTYNYRLTDAKC